MLVQKTNEFSICLKPEQRMINALGKLRTQLASSPYRDDPPHATLVRGIVSKERMGDKELASQVAKLTSIDKKLPLSAVVADVANKSNRFYSESSVLILTPSDDLRLFRQSLLKSLNSHGFSDESYDQNTHPLHVTIRLGIKLEGELLKRTKLQLLDRPVAFSDWFLFRLELEDGARKMHEVKNP